MNNDIKYVHYNRKKVADRININDYSPSATKHIWSFHQSFPEYEETPLVSLDHLAKRLGIEKIFVKDESHRFSLNAFKVLGGSYALGSLIADQLNLDLEKLSFETITSEEVRKQVGDTVFVTATDGNHGRGIAWTANQLKQKSVVFMPRGSSQERLDNIKAYGSDAKIVDMNYDDAVRWARKSAQQNDWILVQDTAWAGYEEIPKRIMQGYTTMANEIVRQLDGEKPTHIFLQAGVGAMAGAITAFFSNYYPGEEQPIIVICEPNKADCIFRTADKADGKLHAVDGDMDTIMAGLACGEPCTIAWDILNDYADGFVSMPDNVAAKGMRILGNPLKGDQPIISGESGAATLGFVADVLENDDLSDLKEKLKLQSDSKVLCISTEGDTDREHYRKVVWNGDYAN